MQLCALRAVAQGYGSRIGMQTRSMTKREHPKILLGRQNGSQATWLTAEPHTSYVLSPLELRDG